MSVLPGDPVEVSRTEAEARPSPEIARDLAIRVEGLSKRYRIGESQEKYKTLRDAIAGWATGPVRRVLAAGRSEPKTQNAIWALEDVSFDVRHGDVVGIIGRNGAGKSTLLKILARITEPTRGRAEIHGRVGSLLEVGTGFHQELTGRDNIYLNGAILGMKRAEIQSKFDEIVAFAEIEKFIDTVVKHYSSGMYLRLAFAVAAHLEPEILLVDEVLAVGDVMFQKKCLGKMEDVARTGRTVLFVSHNMAAVRTLCSTGVVLNEGRVSETGDIGRCIETYFKQIGALQATAAAGDGTPSSGFGRIVINGNQTNSVSQSEKMEVETTVRLGMEASGFSLIMILNDVYDRTIFHVREESPVLGIDSVSPNGVYKVKITVPPLWLNPGVYSVHFKVLSWGNFSNARKVSDKAPIDVTGEYSRVGALLHPPAEWRVVKSEEQ